MEKRKKQGTDSTISKLHKEVIWELVTQVENYQETKDPKYLDKIHILIRKVPNKILNKWLPTVD